MKIFRLKKKTTEFSKRYIETKQTKSEDILNRGQPTNQKVDNDFLAILTPHYLLVDPFLSDC